MTRWLDDKMIAKLHLVILSFSEVPCLWQRSRPIGQKRDSRRAVPAFCHKRSSRRAIPCHARRRDARSARGACGSGPGSIAAQIVATKRVAVSEAPNFDGPAHSAGLLEIYVWPSRIFS